MGRDKEISWNIHIIHLSRNKTESKRWTQYTVEGYYYISVLLIKIKILSEHASIDIQMHISSS